MVWRTKKSMSIGKAWREWRRKILGIVLFEFLMGSAFPDTTV